MAGLRSHKVYDPGPKAGESYEEGKASADILKSLADHTAIYHSRTCKSQARNRAIKKDRTLAFIQKWLLNGRDKRDVVFGFGDGARGWHKGSVSRNMGPVKQIERMMARDTQFVSIDEYRSSQSCSCQTLHGVCCGQLRQARLSQNTGRPLHYLDKSPVGDTIRKAHDVKYCPQCLTTVQRDESAARNIMRLCVAQALGKARPPSMQRPQRRLMPPRIQTGIA